MSPLLTRGGKEKRTLMKGEDFKKPKGGVEKKLSDPFICPFPIYFPSLFTLLPPFVKEGWGEIIWSISFAPSLCKGRLGRVFYSKFFRQIFIIPKISPHPSLKKRGEFFITFPSPSQGEGEGGVV